MNIIKLNDIVMPSEHNISTFFNENLKGRYAYWVQMRYIYPLNSLDYKTYVAYEQMTETELKDSMPHIDLNSKECEACNFIQVYVDSNATELANSINNYSIANAQVTDSDIDISKLRKFRTWLASEILAICTNNNGGYLNNLNEHQIHVLDYYKNNMYNDVVKQLNVFGLDNLQISSVTTGCSCCNSTSLYSLSNVNESCNALNIYTKNLHNLMVSTFENVDFWLQFNKEFISTFKKYIDNIIKVGFVIKPETNVLYIQCNCNDNSVNASTVLLKNLSDALTYIIDNDINGHLNFISDALHNWADQLYDYMYWELK